MNRTLFSLLLALLTISSTVVANDTLPFGEGDIILQGYDKKISGNDFRYNSTVPDINDCMLVRALSGKQSMVWQTEAIPASFEGEYATFVWLAGVGCNMGNKRMEFYINGKKKFEFYTEQRKMWNYNNDDGTALHFRHNAFDGARDQFGFMFLRVPVAKYPKGQPLELKVVGSKSNSQSWYMTFKASLKPGLDFKSFPVIFTENGTAKQAIAASVFHYGKPARAEIYADGKPVKEVSLEFGHNYFRFGWPKVTADQKVKFSLVSGDFKDEKELTIKPVRKWRVNFVQHSHTDIGYTRSQTEILAEHLRFIDYALDYCDATDDYPASSQFRWTCEASWAVDEYLKSRPKEQVERLKKRVKEGRIELTGMYFNFDELPDEQTLAASLAPIKRFKENGLDVKVAMQNDINGIGWCFNDYFTSLGIKYLNMGTHGHRALICFDKPTLFWWESPSGNRMLAFRAEHYMTGNTVFGIHTQNFKLFEDRLLTYLVDLEKKGYPYEAISIQHSGYLTDNAAPSTLAGDIIRQWNEKYEWPQLKTATATEFFKEIEDKHAGELPVYRAAWPDWWTDGFGSGAREVAATRQAHSDIIAYQGALSMATAMGAKLPEGIHDRVDEVNKAILFYDEHTFGSSESVRDPYGQATMEQRALKESYAWEAFRKARMVGEEAMGVLQNRFTKEEKPSIVVFNTMNIARSGLANAYIDYQIVPNGKAFEITNRDGNKIAIQKLSHSHDGAYCGLWVEDIPAFGYKKYFIKLKEEEQPDKAKAEVINEVENRWYKIAIDPSKGVITSLFDKELKKELTDQKSEWGMGQFIYEELGNRSQMEAFYLDDYKRSTLSEVSFDGYEKGEVWNTVRFKGETDAAYAPNGFEFELRLYNTAKRIDFAYMIRKKPVVEPEGIYVAFPFMLENGKMYCDVPGGTMEAGIDQIPGSANDWNTIQNFVSIRNSNEQIIFGCHEAPLMQLGGINTGRYKAGAVPETNHIYGWPMNNYWVTNFNADQRGVFRWVYSFTSLANNSNSVATNTGWGNRVPLLARVLPAGNSKEGESEAGLLSFSADNVLMVNAKPEKGGKTLVLQLRETAGKNTDFTVSNTNKPLTVQEVNVIGEVIAEKSKKITFKPYELKFVRVEL